MQLILASAKIMRSADYGRVLTMTTPAFDDEAHRLAMELSQWSVTDLAKALHCSAAIAMENHQRFQQINRRLLGRTEKIMDKKSNMKKAMYEMFGVGGDGSEAASTSRRRIRLSASWRLSLTPARFFPERPPDRTRFRELVPVSFRIRSTQRFMMRLSEYRMKRRSA